MLMRRPLGGRLGKAGAGRLHSASRPQRCEQRPRPAVLQVGVQASRFCFDQAPWPPSLLASHHLSHRPTAPPARHAVTPAQPASRGSSSRGGGWQWPLALRKPQSSLTPAAGPEAAAAAAASQPQTLADVEGIVAANVPLFTLHHDERYFPCTVEWFLERARLARVAKGWRRRVTRVLADYGCLTPASLAEQQAAWDAIPPKQRRRSLLMLQLRPDARAGQPERLPGQVPVYAHVKQTLDPVSGSRDGIEVNYMTFLAFNGEYRLFRRLWVGPLGAHDADWEHVTVRLTPDGRHVTGVYYSAHRHRDGAWRSAAEVPLSPDGRPLAYIAENGHGSYPVAGTIPRLFLVINDYTSDSGRVWDPQTVVLVTQTPDGRLPAVVSRGSTLDGSSYACRPPLPHLKVQRSDAPWLRYTGRWGSTVLAPQLQEWAVRAENPVSRTPLQQVLLPLLPGVDSVLEPAQEEVEAALEAIQDGTDEGMAAFAEATAEVQAEFARAREGALRRWERLLRRVGRRDD